MNYLSQRLIPNLSIKLVVWNGVIWRQGKSKLLISISMYTLKQQKKKKEYFYHNTIIKNLYVKCILFLQIKMLPHTGAEHKLHLKIFIFPTFYHQNTQNLTYFFILIFPIFTIFLTKIALLYESDLKILTQFLYSPHFLSLPLTKK